MSVSLAPYLPRGPRPAGCTPALLFHALQARRRDGARRRALVSCCIVYTCAVMEYERGPYNTLEEVTRLPGAVASSSYGVLSSQGAVQQAPYAVLDGLHAVIRYSTTC